MAFAERIGLHPTYIAGVERGEGNVSLVNIHVIASGLAFRQAGFLPIRALDESRKRRLQSRLPR
jgi:transcriptional regulator with XRE-family HTH domain